MKFFVAIACLLAVASAVAIDDVQVISNVADVRADGYNYAYELSNGVAASESGALTGPEDSIVAQGGFKFISPEGESFNVQYTADAGGFQPIGAHLPVGPEVPVLIQRALEYIAAHPNPNVEH